MMKKYKKFILPLLLFVLLVIVLAIVVFNFFDKKSGYDGELHLVSGEINEGLVSESKIGAETEKQGSLYSGTNIVGKIDGVTDGIVGDANNNRENTIGHKAEYYDKKYPPHNGLEERDKNSFFEDDINATGDNNGYVIGGVEEDINWNLNTNSIGDSGSSLANGTSGKENLENIELDTYEGRPEKPGTNISENAIAKNDEDSKENTDGKPESNTNEGEADKGDINANTTGRPEANEDTSGNKGANTNRTQVGSVNEKEITDNNKPNTNVSNINDGNSNDLAGEDEADLNDSIKNEKKPTIISMPQVIECEFNGCDQVLLVGGESEEGTFYYSLDGKKWSKEIPKIRDAGLYDVFFYLKGKENYSDSEVYKVPAKIHEKEILYESIDGHTTYSGEKTDGGAAVLLKNDDGKFTVRWGLVEGEYELNEIPQFTDAGEYNIFYEISRKNYKTIRGSLSIVIDKAEQKIELSKKTGKLIFPMKTMEIEVTKNLSEAPIMVKSIDEKVAKAKLDDGKIVIEFIGSGDTDIIITTEENENYTLGEIVFPIECIDGTIEVAEVNGVGVYDGNPIRTQARVDVVTDVEAVILYGEKEDECILTDIPEYTDAGEYTIYYKVSAEHYSDYFGQLTIDISKAEGRIIVPQFFYQISCLEEEEMIIDINSDADCFIASSDDSDIVECSVFENKLILEGGFQGKALITISIEETENYYGSTENIEIEVSKISSLLELSEYSGTMYQAELVRKIDITTNNTEYSDEDVIVSSTDSSIAEGKVENGELVITWNGKGEATLEVTIPETIHFGAATKKYVLECRNNILKVHSKDGKDTYNGQPTSGNAEIIIDSPINQYEIYYGYAVNACNMSSMPTYSNAGVYTLFYKVSAQYYDDYFGSLSIVIDKAENELVISSNGGSTCIGKSLEFSVTTNKSGGTLNVVCGDLSQARLNVSENKIEVTPLKQTLVVISITSEETNNYLAKTVNYVATFSGHSQISCDNAGAATCETNGKESDTKCSVCNIVLTEGKVIPALQHKYTSKVTSEVYLRSKATCTGKATYYYKCERCASKGTGYYEYGNANGHSQISCNNAVAATCETNGKESDTKCSVCNTILSVGKSISPIGHSFGSMIVNDSYKRTNATCTSKATYFYKCNRCSAKGTEYYSYGNANGHTSVSSNNAIAPTCTTNGKESDTKCSVCGVKLSVGNTIAATGHSYNSDMRCNGCGKEISITNSYNEFFYNNGIHAFLARAGKIYKLEVWGAQGGGVLTDASYDNYTRTCDIRGGFGGYASGYVTFPNDTTLYICVGGDGGKNTCFNMTHPEGFDLYNIVNPGYNGGGRASCAINGNGGGATHIATTNRGELYNYDSHRSEVLIVAGGGGGSALAFTGWEGDENDCNGMSWYMIGGAGGGMAGENGSGGGNGILGWRYYGISDHQRWYTNERFLAYGLGGTQSSGGGDHINGTPTGSFGRGGNGQRIDSLWRGGAGGGAGWYGGGAGGEFEGSCPGGGGSSYIGGVRRGSTTANVREGNGYAKITLCE